MQSTLDTRTADQKPRFSTEKHWLGALCLRGHDAGGGRSWRHINHRNCVECTRERARSWRAENPERAKASTRRRDEKRDKSNRRERWPFSVYLGAVRKRATVLGLPFDLKPDDLRALWQAQEGRCFWTGEVLDFYVGAAKHPFRPSLDRQDPKAGYVVGNVVWSSNFANRARGDLPAAQFALIMARFGFGPANAYHTKLAAAHARHRGALA